MIVVADSSPLHYLILLDQAEILWRLYENVLIPDAVAAELGAASAPRLVSEWMLRRRYGGVRPSIFDATSVDLETSVALKQHDALRLAGTRTARKFAMVVLT